ncbi:Mur ligase [Phlebopus sp. FC_14]|nr:Mur ligase [Phlebopus sp. FC_14]
MSIDLSLERVRLLASQFPYTRPTIHVAGTNGKGSVTSIVASILRASSFSVGRFNSPHLVSIYDCILINGDPVSPEAYHNAREMAIEANNLNDFGATSFELLTVTALLVFEEAQVDIAVVEVGMGGRLDATNVIQDECILVSALTTVDLDHQAFLGHTVELIAREKAAIARQGKPFVLGAQKHPVVEEVVRNLVDPEQFLLSPPVQRRPVEDERSFSLSAEPFVPPPGQAIEYTSSAFTSPIHAALPLYGAHQLDNLALSLTLITTLKTHPSCRKALSTKSDLVSKLDQITNHSVCTGIQNVSWPGRLSFHRIASREPLIPLTVLVDGAHNPASSQMLASYISDIIAQCRTSCSTIHLTYILGLSHSPPKTPSDTLSPLLRSPTGSSLKVSVAVLRFSPPEGMPWVKSVAPSALKETVLQLVSNADVWSMSDDEPVECQLRGALDWASAQAKSGDGVERLVVLAGSLYLVADFYRLLKTLEVGEGVAAA